MYKEYNRKAKKELTRVNKEMERMRMKIEAYRSLHAEVPTVSLKNGFSHLFTVSRGMVKYSCTANQQTMLCFSTAIVGAENFVFRCHLTL